MSDQLRYFISLGIRIDDNVAKTLSSLNELLKDTDKRELLGRLLETRKEKMKKLSEAGQALFNAIESDSEINLEDSGSNPFFVIEFSAKIDEAIKQNSSAGWPLTNNMDVISYIEINEKCSDDKDRGKLFVEMFESGNSALYEEEKENTLEDVNEKYKDLLRQVFNAFERKEWLIAIPSLLLIIEGIIADTLSDNRVGKQLIKEIKKLIDKEKNDFNTLITLSLANYLEKKTFRNRDFEKKRSINLNRHWVLHGRDDVRLWTEEDFYSLLCVISSITTIEKVIRK